MTAGVVVCLAGAGLVAAGTWAGRGDRPGPSASAPSSAGAGTVAPAVPRAAGSIDRPPPLTARNWSTVTYPLACGGAGARVLTRRYADLTGDGYVDAVTLVTCGAGSPPDALYVYDGRSPAGVPRLLAALLTGAEGDVVTRLTLTAGTITVAADGYAAAAGPSASPGADQVLRWRWNGLRFVPAPSAGVPA